MTATFYVLPVLFGQDEYIEMKLKYLAEHGYDIGNHTVSHAALSKITPEKATQEIAGNIDIVRKYLPGYEEKSIALPLGEEPKEQSVLASGTSGETTYNFVASLLVGSNPAPAPNDREFNPMRLPRVQALALSHKEGSVGSDWWIQYFRDNPERRYRSDGDPAVITIPKHVQPRIKQESLGDKRSGLIEDVHSRSNKKIFSHKRRLRRMTGAVSHKVTGKFSEQPTVQARQSSLSTSPG